VIGTDHVDAQLDDGLPADLVLGMPRATIADLDRARAIVCSDPSSRRSFPCSTCGSGEPRSSSGFLSSTWAPATTG